MLQLQKIHKTYLGSKSSALSELSLNCESGSFTVILGSNGSGKTTLLRSISGEINLDGGEILLGGKNITDLSVQERARQISSVSQDLNTGTIGDLSLLENLALSNLRGESPRLVLFDHLRSSFFERLAKLGRGFESHLDRPLKDLSGGERQTLALIMATLKTPKLLLLDEHTSALDPTEQINLMNRTEDLVLEQGLTTLMITHNLETAIRYGDRLILMDRGRIVSQLSSSEKVNLTVVELLELISDQRPELRREQ